MARKKPIPQPSAFVLAQRPRLAAEANGSNIRIDELDAQNEWQAHIAAGRIIIR